MFFRNWPVIRLTALLVIIAGATLVSAQIAKPSQSHGQQQQQTITDAAGRVHTRTSRITHAQRKAVAERMKAARIAAAQKKNGGKQ